MRLLNFMRFAIMAIAGLTSFGSHAAADTWRCVPAGILVTCDHGQCAAETEGLSVELYFSPTGFKFCAFSGCWEGTPQWHPTANGLEFASLISLNWNGDVEHHQSHAIFGVVFDTKTRMAQISGQGFYSPLVCEKFQHD